MSMRSVLNILRFFLIFFLLSAGPATKRLEVRGGGGFYNNDYFLNQPGCGEEKSMVDVRIKDKGYASYWYISSPLNEYASLQFSFISGYHSSNYEETYEESSRYNGRLISKTSSRGEFFIPHLSLSLDTLVTGIRINGMALFYRGGAQPFPGLSLWVGHRLFYLFLGINDFNTIPLMHAISYGFGSDNRYFKLEAGAVLNPIYPSAKKPDTSIWHDNHLYGLSYITLIYKIRQDLGAGIITAYDGEKDDYKSDYNKGSAVELMLFLVLYKD